MEIKREIDVRLSNFPLYCTNCDKEIAKYDVYLAASVADDHHKTLYVVCSLECEKVIEEEDSE